MKLIVLTKSEAEEVAGEYSPHHEIRPVKIEEDVYILPDGLDKIVSSESKKEKILNKPSFITGDDSSMDKKYQKFKENKMKEETEEKPKKPQTETTELPPPPPTPPPVE